MSRPTQSKSFVYEAERIAWRRPENGGRSAQSTTYRGVEMRLHDGKPWRAVVHIDEATGKRGGALWSLTLECGHRAFRPRRVPRPDNMVLDARLQTFTAPHRVRCLWC